MLVFCTCTEASHYLSMFDYQLYTDCRDVICSKVYYTPPKNGSQSVMSQGKST